MKEACAPQKCRSGADFDSGVPAQTLFHAGTGSPAADARRDSYACLVTNFSPGDRRIAEIEPDAARRWRRVGAALVWAEAAGLAAVAVSALVAAPHTTGWTSDVPRARVAASEVVIYLLFAAGVSWLGLRVLRGRGRVWTPFVLIQAFALIAAWPMMTSDLRGYQLAGALTIAVGVAGLVTAWLWVRSDPSALVAPNTRR